MKTFDIKSALIGALFAAGITLSVAAATGSRTTWDYRVFTARADDDEFGRGLNSRVAEGWELVSVSGPNNSNYGIVVMRREKQ
jgi:hypothetical protein